MKVGTVLHNPGAGHEGHEEEDLTRLLQKHGYISKYVSVNSSSWKKFDFQTDFLIIAGGDGTVRKVLKALLDRKMVAKTWPIAVLPLGTANNIAKTLNLEADTETNIKAWDRHKTKRMDVGCLYYKKENNFFLESFGYGLFPYLMLEMKKKEKDYETPDAKIKEAQKLLYDLTMSYEPRNCKLIIDEVDYSGKYLLVELMNTQSIGPNLKLAPGADPGDGLLEVVVVAEEDKDRFGEYLQNKIQGIEAPFEFRRIQGRSIVLSWEGTHVHIDDETLKFAKNQEVCIETKRELLEFLVT